MLFYLRYLKLQTFVLNLLKTKCFGGDFEKFEQQGTWDEINGCHVSTCTREERAVKKVDNRRIKQEVSFFEF